MPSLPLHVYTLETNPEGSEIDEESVVQQGQVLTEHPANSWAPWTCKNREFNCMYFHEPLSSNLSNQSSRVSEIEFLPTKICLLLELHETPCFPMAKVPVPYLPGQPIGHLALHGNSCCIWFISSAILIWSQFSAAAEFKISVNSTLF
jgi:hypothetical protein